VVSVRPAAASDGAALASLISDYMHETYDRPWGGSLDALTRDASRVECLLALDAVPIGFAAWTPAYDLHHCMPGGDLIDLYVAPSHRARGVAAMLVAAAADRIRARGGRYLSGLGVASQVTGKLYARLAMQFPGAACIVGGRAFRALADLAGKPAREIVRGLPDKSWNYQP
jgi:GNAT superfamily N-acetyltransferase